MRLAVAVMRPRVELPQPEQVRNTLKIYEGARRNILELLVICDFVAAANCALGM